MRMECCPAEDPHCSNYFLKSVFFFGADRRIASVVFVSLTPPALSVFSSPARLCAKRESGQSGKERQRERERERREGQERGTTRDSHWTSARLNPCALSPSLSFSLLFSLSFSPPPPLSYRILSASTPYPPAMHNTLCPALAQCHF